MFLRSKYKGIILQLKKIQEVLDERYIFLCFQILSLPYGMCVCLHTFSYSVSAEKKLYAK